MADFEITLSAGLVTYDVEADSEEEAIDNACEDYEERSMEIIHVNRPEKDDLDRIDLYALEDILNYILDHAKEEQDCTDEENDFLADCQNLKESTRRWLREGKYSPYSGENAFKRQTIRTQKGGYSSNA